MRPKYEVADVIRQFLPKMNKQKTLVHHRKTLQALTSCRTEALGGHIDSCDKCGHLNISYNSCRNRHCPKCQGVNKEMWIVQQEDMLLPVAYFHVVFTLPHELNELCMHQPKFMYGLLFKAAWHTLNTLANDPKWLGAKTAATMPSRPLAVLSLKCPQDIYPTASESFNHILGHKQWSYIHTSIASSPTAD